MRIKNLEQVSINNSDQWLLVRGDTDAPLILQIQAGPGLPMIPEANMLQRLLHLEDNFLVAYWDQRGCGKSFNKNENPRKINLDQLADDVISCTQYLLQKYKQEKINLIGYSVGGTISLLAAQKAPHLFSNIFPVGVDIDVPSADHFMLEFLAAKIKQGKNRKWEKEIDKLRSVEVNNAKVFQKRAKLISNAGGIISNKNYNDIFFGTLKNMLFAREYSLIDTTRAIRGMKFCQDALLPEFGKLNLFEKIKTIPAAVHFIQGIKDAVAPGEIATAYFEYLDAESKSFTQFQHSAHLPHLEEPGKFAGLIRATIDKPGAKKEAAAVVISNQRNNKCKKRNNS